MMERKGWISGAEDILRTIEGPEAVEEVRAAAAHFTSDLDGKLAGGEDWLAQHIGSRAKRGQEWHEQFGALQKLAESSRYIRILGRGFQPVSISDLNPCGHLRGERGKIRVRGRLERAIAVAHAAMEEKPATDKPEHRLQAFLIQAAMRNDLDLSPVLPRFPEVFDQLLFVTDELSLAAGKVRADIVALGGKGDAHFPIFIDIHRGESPTPAQEADGATGQRL